MFLLKNSNRLRLCLHWKLNDKTFVVRDVCVCVFYTSEQQKSSADKKRWCDQHFVGRKALPPTKLLLLIRRGSFCQWESSLLLLNSGYTALRAF